MTAAQKQKTFPITFDISQEQHRQLKKLQREYKLSSISDLVRLAVSRFNFARVPKSSQDHQQISVRLGADDKAVLSTTSKARNTSVGELLRTALDELFSNPPGKDSVQPQTSTNMPTKKTAKKKTARKAAKKVPSKKTARKAVVKKAAAKKTAVKKVAKKKVVAKKAVKKAVKKAAAKKVTARKATKKAVKKAPAKKVARKGVKKAAKKAPAKKVAAKKKTATKKKASSKKK